MSLRAVWLISIINSILARPVIGPAEERELRACLAELAKIPQAAEQHRDLDRQMRHYFALRGRGRFEPSRPRRRKK